MMELSVIIPAYNAGNYINSCVSSLYDQGLDLTAFEVIIINDGSTDGSLLQIQELARRHTNIIVIDQQNKGLSATRNIGISRASGRYVFFLDSDDFVYPNSLQILIEKAIQFDLDVLRFDYWRVDEAGNRLSQSDHFEKRKAFDTHLGDGLFLFKNIYNQEFFSCLSFVKRDLLLQQHLYFIEGMFFEDVEFSIKLSLVATRTMYMALPIYAYRQHANSILHTFNKKKAEDVILIASNLQNYLDDVSLDSEFKAIIKENITQLMVSVLIKMAGPQLYQERKSLFRFMRMKHVKHLYPTSKKRELVVSLLFNALGIYVVSILHWVILLREKIA